MKTKNSYWKNEVAKDESNSSRPMTMKETYGLKMDVLKQWSQESLYNLQELEESKQEIAVKKVRDFMDYVAKTIKLQSWVRMIKHRRKFNQRYTKKLLIKSDFFIAWKKYLKATKMYKYQSVGKYLLAWNEDVKEDKRLNDLILKFFEICIQRLKLTPQAVIAYTNPMGWKLQISESDKMKIRRLLLEKLFFSWKKSTYDLRLNRYKASQILARMMRRTRGPLWVKEVVLVCYHMWHRYSAVKQAYRYSKPDPRFTNPHLPQWTKLYKDITIQRMQRKRVLEKGHSLTLRRNWRSWRYLMTIDRTKKITPMDVAIRHHNQVLKKRMYAEWYSAVRRRGGILRYRTKLFLVWANWAPKQARLSKLYKKTTEWLRLKQMKKSFEGFTSLCLDIIGKRTTTLKKLRGNFCDRKIVICAYALLNKDAHVLMIDCWRRLVHYWRCRRHWKTFAWHYKYQWFFHKAKIILYAWRCEVLRSKGLKIPFHDLLWSSEIHRDQYTTVDPQDKKGGLLLDGDDDHAVMVRSHSPQNHDDSAHDIRSPHPSTHHSVSRVSRVLENNKKNFNQNLENYLNFQSHRKKRFLTFDKETSYYHPLNTNQFENTIQSMEGGGGVNEDSAPWCVTSTMTPMLLNLVDGGGKGLLKQKPSKHQFHFFSQALTRCLSNLNRQVNLLQFDDLEVMQSNSKSSDGMTIQKPRGIASTPMTARSDGRKGGMILESVQDSLQGSLVNTLFNNQEDSNPMARLQSKQQRKRINANLLSSHPNAEEEDVAEGGTIFHPILQRDLQMAIDNFDLDRTVEVIGNGAIVDTHHVRQVAKHVGDQFIPLFSVLLGSSMSYMASRILHHDRKVQVNECGNPVNAWLLASQIDRWERCDITYREITSLTEDIHMDENSLSALGPLGPTPGEDGSSDSIIGDHFMSIQLWRCVALKLLDARADQMQRTCKTLPGNRTVEEEVVEVLKRQKITRYREIRRGLSLTIGLFHVDTEDYESSIAPLPTLIALPNKPLHVSTEELKPIELLKRNIYIVLREFTLLNGKLANEARSLRCPIMDRDAILLTNSFVKQARADFLTLKQMCVTEAQKKAEREKAERLAKKTLKKQKKGLKEVKSKEGNGGKKTKKKFSDAMDSDEDSVDEEGGEGGDRLKLSASRDSAVRTVPSGSQDSGIGMENEEDIPLLDDINEVLDEMFKTLKQMVDSPIEDVVELNYQQRTQSVRNNWLELWTPIASREVSTVQLALRDRMMNDMKRTLLRVFQTMMVDPTIGRIKYPIIAKDYGGVGLWLIERVLTEPSRKNAAVWKLLPKDYWTFRNVKERMRHETISIQSCVQVIQESLGETKAMNREHKQNIKEYQKYLVDMRKNVFDVSMRRNVKRQNDLIERGLKVQGLKKLTAQYEAETEAMESMKKKVNLGEILMNSRNFVGTLSSLDGENVRLLNHLNGVEVLDEKVLEGLATESMQQMKQQIEEMKDLVQEKKEKVEVARQGLERLDRTVALIDKLMKDLVTGRFLNIIDVQNILLRTNHTLKSSKTTKDQRLVKRNKYRRYLKRLHYFQTNFIDQRGTQLAKDRDLARYAELGSGTISRSQSGEFKPRPLSRAMSPHDAAMGTNTPPRLNSSSQKSILKKSGNQVDMMGMEGSSSPKVATPSKLHPFSLLGPNGHSDLVIEDLYEDILASEEIGQLIHDEVLAPGTAAKIFADDESDNGLTDEQKQQMDNEADLAVSEFLRDAEEAAEAAELEAQEAAAAGNKDMMIDHDAEQFNFGNTLALDGMQPRKLTIEEEIMLAYQSTPQYIAEHAEEMRVMAEEQARQLAIHELRLSTYEAYWTIVPKRIHRNSQSAGNDSLNGSLDESAPEFQFMGLENFPARRSSDLQSLQNSTGQLVRWSSRPSKAIQSDGEHASVSIERSSQMESFQGGGQSSTSQLNDDEDSLLSLSTAKQDKGNTLQFLTRSARMWKSIGDSYWRQRSELIATSIQREIENARSKIYEMFGRVGPNDIKSGGGKDVSDSMFRASSADLLASISGRHDPLQIAKLLSASRSSDDIFEDLIDVNRLLQANGMSMNPNQLLDASYGKYNWFLNRGFIQEVKSTAAFQSVDPQRVWQSVRSDANKLDESSISMHPENTEAEVLIGDPFMIRGQQEHERFKASMFHRASNPLDEGDTSFTIESRLGEQGLDSPNDSGTPGRRSSTNASRKSSMRGSSRRISSSFSRPASRTSDGHQIESPKVVLDGLSPQPIDGTGKVFIDDFVSTSHQTSPSMNVPAVEKADPISVHEPMKIVTDEMLQTYEDIATPPHSPLVLAPMMPTDVVYHPNSYDERAMEMDDEYLPCLEEMDNDVTSEISAEEMNEVIKTFENPCMDEANVMLEGQDIESDEVEKDQAEVVRKLEPPQVEANETENEDDNEDDNDSIPSGIKSVELVTSQQYREYLEAQNEMRLKMRSMDGSESFDRTAASEDGRVLSDDSQFYIVSSDALNTPPMSEQSLHIVLSDPSNPEAPSPKNRSTRRSVQWTPTAVMHPIHEMNESIAASSLHPSPMARGMPPSSSTAEYELLPLPMLAMNDSYSFSTTNSIDLGHSEPPRVNVQPVVVNSTRGLLAVKSKGKWYLQQLNPTAVRIESVQNFIPTQQTFPVNSLYNLYSQPSPWVDRGGSEFKSPGGDARHNNRSPHRPISATLLPLTNSNLLLQANLPKSPKSALSISGKGFPRDANKVSNPIKHDQDDDSIGDKDDLRITLPSGQFRNGERLAEGSLLELVKELKHPPKETKSPPKSRFFPKDFTPLDHLEPTHRGKSQEEFEVIQAAQAEWSLDRLDMNSSKWSLPEPETSLLIDGMKVYVHKTNLDRKKKSTRWIGKVSRGEGLAKSIRESISHQRSLLSESNDSPGSEILTAPITASIPHKSIDGLHYSSLPPSEYLGQPSTDDLQVETHLSVTPLQPTSSSPTDQDKIFKYLFERAKSRVSRSGIPQSPTAGNRNRLNQKKEFRSESNSPLRDIEHLFAPNDSVESVNLRQMQRDNNVSQLLQVILRGVRKEVNHRRSREGGPRASHPNYRTIPSHRKGAENTIKLKLDVKPTINTQDMGSIAVVDESSMMLAPASNALEYADQVHEIADILSSIHARSGDNTMGDLQDGEDRDVALALSALLELDYDYQPINTSLDASAHPVKINHQFTDFTGNGPVSHFIYSTNDDDSEDPLNILHKLLDGSYVESNPSSIVSHHSAHPSIQSTNNSLYDQAGRDYDEGDDPLNRVSTASANKIIHEITGMPYDHTPPPGLNSGGIASIFKPDTPGVSLLSIPDAWIPRPQPHNPFMDTSSFTSDHRSNPVASSANLLTIAGKGIASVSSIAANSKDMVTTTHPSIHRINSDYDDGKSDNPPSELSNLSGVSKAGKSLPSKTKPWMGSQSNDSLLSKGSPMKSLISVTSLSNVRKDGKISGVDGNMSQSPMKRRRDETSSDEVTFQDTIPDVEDAEERSKAMTSKTMGGSTVLNNDELLQELTNISQFKYKPSQLRPNPSSSDAISVGEYLKQRSALLLGSQINPQTNEFLQTMGNEFKVKGFSNPFPNRISTRSSELKEEMDNLNKLELELEEELRASLMKKRKDPFIGQTVDAESQIVDANVLELNRKSREKLTTLDPITHSFKENPQKKSFKKSINSNSKVSVHNKEGRSLVGNHLPPLLSLSLSGGISLSDDDKSLKKLLQPNNGLLGSKLSHRSGSILNGFN